MNGAWGEDVQAKPDKVNLQMKSEIVRCSAFAVVSPKYWPSFPLTWDIGDSGRACATHLRYVHDQWCLRC